MAGELEALIDEMKKARKIFVITGAGVSAESGVPTFRGKDGLWRNYDAMQLATPEAFERDPVLVWEWYLWRRSLIAEAEPNPAHKILASWEERYPDFLIATQNVDRLHQRAGNRHVEEIHGNIWETRCTRTGQVYSPEEKEVRGDHLPPESPAGGLLRPNVVWFGEILPTGPLERINSFLSSSNPNVCFVIGTSALFYYIQSWAVTVKMRGGLLVEVNPDTTPLSEISDFHLEKPAAPALALIDSLVSGSTPDS